MSKTHGSVQLMQRQVDALRVREAQLQNKLDSTENIVLQNSFPIFSAAAFNTSELASITPLSYNNVYAPLTLQYQTLMYAYKSQPVLQNAIDMPVQDALRSGLDFRSDELDKDDIKELEEHLDNSQFYLAVKTLEQWARLFGGAAMLINTEQDPATPLNVKGLMGKKIKFYPAARWELSGAKRYQEFYDFYGVRFHRSRVLTVSGKEAPFQIRFVLNDWGLSEIEKLMEPFNIYLRTQNAIYDLLKEAKVDVFQFDGFLAQLTSNAGTQRALQRIQLMNQAKNSSNALVMDLKDKYEQKQVTFSGLAEMAVQNRISLASATRIPMNKLFGTGASGFSSGEDDIENYNAMVESEIREHLRPTLRALLDIVEMNLWGEDFDLPFDFKPLRVLSAEKEEVIKSSKHIRYFQDMQAGMLTPKEYMDLQQKEKLIPIETEVAQGATPEPVMTEAQPEGEEKDTKKQGDSK